MWWQDEIKSILRSLYSVEIQSACISFTTISHVSKKSIACNPTQENKIEMRRLLPRLSKSWYNVVIGLYLSTKDQCYHHPHQHLFALTLSTSCLHYTDSSWISNVVFLWGKCRSLILIHFLSCNNWFVLLYLLNDAIWQTLHIIVFTKELYKVHLWVHKIPAKRRYSI